MAKTKAAETATVEQTGTAPVTFSKAQILTFKRFATRRDLLKVKLEEGQTYTMDQVEAVIRDFMTPKGKKGKVND